MRSFFILFNLIIVSQFTLMGCQTTPSLAPSFDVAGGMSQSISSAQKIMSAPASIGQSAAPISTLSESANTASSAMGMVTDALGSRSSESMSGSDTMPKVPFSIGGAFSGAMVAIGLKDSPAELAAKEQLQAVKDFAASQVPRRLNVIVEASADANGDASGHGFSTIFRFYALSDVATFAKIGLEEAGDSHGLPYQEELILPNHFTQIYAKYSADSQFMALSFQLHQRAHRWRLLIPVKRLQAGKPLRLALGRCDVRVKEGLIPVSIVTATATPTAALPTLKKPQVSVIETELSSVCQ
jgi:predicted component of type VI protein secretion system